MNQSNNLPLLLKRKHLLREFGLSDSLYYALLQSGELPTITLNGRKYIHRDKFLELINSTSIINKGDINYGKTNEISNI